MKNFKTISCTEFRKKKGDLIVLGAYSKNNIIFSDIIFNCAQAGTNIVAFNLKDEYKDYLNKKIFDTTVMEGALCIDYALEDEDTTTIKRVIGVCKQAKEEFGNITALFDFNNDIYYTVNELLQLKQLANDLNIVIVISADINETDASPSLSDFNNQALVDIADTIIVGKSDEDAVMLKNKSGDTGILSSYENTTFEACENSV